MSRATFAVGKSISPSRRTRCCAPIESARALSEAQAGTLSQLDTPSLLFSTHAAQPVHIYPNAENMRGFRSAQYYYIVKWLLTRGEKKVLHV